MRQLGICPPQLLASLPITTLFLPRGTRLFFFFSFFITVLSPILSLELLFVSPTGSRDPDS